MRKGTFSVENAKAHSSKHNSRELSPKYLIDDTKSNYYELIIKDEEFKEQAQLKYKEIIKQNMQKKQIPGLIKETVLTIKENQNEDDIKSLFKELNKEFGGHHLTELSIHRDEGHFLKDDIAYYPTKNILKKENEWYICSDINITKPKKDDFDKLVDIDDFQKIYNYHAHAKFSMFDMSTGKIARMNKGQMSKRIKFVSDYLGLDYNPGKDRFITKSVNQIKDEHLVKANEKAQELAKQKDLKLQIAIAREEWQKEKATREDYAALEELNRELKKKISNKQITIDEMQNEIDTLNEQFNSKIKPYELEEELERVLDEHLEEKDVKVGLFGKETKTIVEDKFSFRNALTQLFTKGGKYLAKMYSELKNKYKDLKDQYYELQKENEFLKELIKKLQKDNQIKNNQIKNEHINKTFFRDRR